MDWLIHHHSFPNNTRGANSFSAQYWQLTISQWVNNKTTHPAFKYLGVLCPVHVWTLTSWTRQAGRQVCEEKKEKSFILIRRLLLDNDVLHRQSCHYTSVGHKQSRWEACTHKNKPDSWQISRRLLWPSFGFSFSASTSNNVSWNGKYDLSFIRHWSKSKHRFLISFTKARGHGKCEATIGR